jgi:hypothetical protein
MRTFDKAVSFGGGFLVTLGVGIGDDATAAKAAADVAQSTCFQKPVPAIHARKGPNRISFSPVSAYVFNCAPAYWGSEKADQIRALGRRPEMLPWTLGSDYDRPIPRRFAEEAGLRRGSFANKKMAASFNRKYGRPLSVSLRQDFADFMRRHGGRAAPGFVEGTALALRALDALVLRRLRPRLRMECKSWIKLPAPSMFFIWANERRTAHYLSGLRQADLLHEARLPPPERLVVVGNRDTAIKGSP